MKTLSKTLLGMMMMVLLLVGVVGQVAAAPPAQQGDGSRLELALQAAELRLDALQDRLENSQNAADLLEAFIADEQARGFDTSILEDALAAFRAELDVAQGFADDAAQIIAEKAGFDSDGNVVDNELARQTIESANQSIRDGSETLRQAREDLREARREYRETTRENRRNN